MWVLKLGNTREQFEGYNSLVCQVPGELMISAQAGSHSFDASNMNMTHYVGFFSFGRKLSWRAVRWVNELLPELDTNIDRLTGNEFLSEYENITVCKTFVYFPHPDISK